MRPGAETPIETLGRVTLLNMGIDDLELQYVISFPNGGMAVCDIYSRGLNHVFECDGRIKYQNQFDSRGNVVTPEEVVWREKGREDKVRGQGVGFSRMTWQQVQPDSFERTSARLWREIRQQAAARNLRRHPAREAAWRQLRPRSSRSNAATYGMPGRLDRFTGPAVHDHGDADHFGTCFAECVDGLHHGSTRRRRVLHSQDAATGHVRTFDAALETVRLAFLAYDERVELAS